MKIRKAVIPAAGLGTRFLPITKSIPKEMLPIVDKPCIQYLVEEAVNSGIEEIIFVINRDKKSIKKYFNTLHSLDKKLKESGKNEAYKTIKKIEDLASFHFVNQSKPKGDGHAILCARKYLRNEPFAVLFGDDIYDSNPPALAQLIALYNKTSTPIISLENVEKKDTEKYGIIDPLSKNGRSYKIKQLVEKPKATKAPSTLAITGKYIITPELFETLKSAKPGKDGELRIIDAMRQFIKSSPIHGYEIKGKRFDTGDKLGYLKAVTHFSGQDKELGKEFRRHLNS